MRYVSLKERVPFRCQRCGRCCRNLEDSLMLEPLDVYNISRHLREQGCEILGPEDMLSQYAHPNLLDGVYPMFQVNTVGEDHACVFLKDGSCSVYAARPQVCRMYPFGAEPGTRGRDFCYYLCTEQPHHFENGMVTVNDWLSENFSKTAREFLKAHYELLPLLGKTLRALGDMSSGVAFRTLYYLYFGYDLSKPFLPQYRANMAELMKELAKEADKVQWC